MKLLGVQAIDVLGVESGVYSFERGPGEAHDHVLITGGPGTGKTRLLELIAASRELLAPIERVMDQESFIIPGNETAKVILSWQLTPDEQEVIGASSPVATSEVIFRYDEEDEVDSRMGFLLERYGHDDATPKLEYFSEQRRLDIGGGEVSLDEDEQIRFRGGASPRKFAFVPAFLEVLPDRLDRAARFQRTLERFSPSCTYDLERQTLLSRGRPIRDLTQLSASEADSVMFAATAALVGLSGSIVLVDRPELHGIPPDRALAGLAALGSDNQLILASPSPALAAGFDGAIVRLGADPSANGGLR